MKTTTVGSQRVKQIKEGKQRLKPSQREPNIVGQAKGLALLSAGYVLGKAQAGMEMLSIWG